MTFGKQRQNCVIIGTNSREKQQ